MILNEGLGSYWESLESCCKHVLLSPFYGCISYILYVILRNA